MLRLAWIVALIGSLCVVATKAYGQSTQRWIVELEAPSLLDHWRQYVALKSPQAGSVDSLTGIDAADQRQRLLDHYGPQLRQTQEGMLAELSAFAPAWPSHRYLWTFNGFALELTDQQRQWLDSHPQVRALYPEVYYQPAGDVSAEWVRADQVWSGISGVGSSRGENVLIGIADTGINARHRVFEQNSPDGYSYPPFGAFLGLCARGRDFCNNKLVGVYELTEGISGFRGANGLDLSGHGTHVASTAAGNPGLARISGSGYQVEREVSGIAPRARLVSYRVCAFRTDAGDDDDGRERCPRSAIVAAIDQSVQDGADILNLSLGGDENDPWTEYPGSLAAADAGVLLIAAAGNEGPAATTLRSPSIGPWFMSIANASHDRRVLNSVIDTTGGAQPLQEPLRGDGLTAGLEQRPVVYAGDFGHALCSQGDDIDFPPTGASNPFAPGTFDGQIVVCERGVQARVAKGFNVRAAGAAGMILINTPADGEATVADAHHLPATHLGARDGQKLLDWLASGEGHRAALTGLSFERDDQFADRLTSSSSRGPSSRVPDVLAPDMAAPGSNILAADMSGTAGSATNIEYGFKTGTSMATPQVSGAAALLKSLHPGWSAQDIRSALVTTARPEMLDSVDGLPADAFKVGAGMLDVAAAARAGISLRETRQRFQSANPASGGIPRQLNLPGLFHRDCGQTCEWQRSLRSLRSGEWSVSLDLPIGVTGQVSPSSISYSAPGQLRSLNVSVDTSAAPLNRWLQGSVVLQEQSTGVVQRLPLAVFAPASGLPSILDIQAQSLRGSAPVSINTGVEVNNLYLTAHPLVRPQARSFSGLSSDPDPDEPYDNLPGGFAGIEVFDVQSAALVLVEFRRQSGTPRLFVGRDTSGQGLPTENAQLCAASSGGNSVLRCLIRQPADGRYWAYVQNISGSGAGEVSIAVVPLAGSAAANLFPVASARYPDGQVALDLAWDEAQLTGGEMIGALSLSRRNALLDDITTVAVRIRGGNAPAAYPAPMKLGQEQRLSLAAGEQRTGDFLLIPPQGVAGRLRLDGQSVTAYLRRDEPFDPQLPLSGQADRQVVVSGQSNVELDGGVVWHLALDASDSSADRTVRLSWTLPETANQGLEPGVWFNPARDGHGMEFNRLGDSWFLLWYSYDQQGEPTWYLAQAEAQREDFWQAPLMRFVWQGDAAHGQEVGLVQMAADQQGRQRFSAGLLGSGMTEPLVGIEPVGGCAVPDPSGAWFAPQEPGWGFTLLAGADLSSEVYYLYDEYGNPRWVLGQAEPDEPMTQSYFVGGFCPWCSWQAPTAIAAGESLLQINSEGSAELFLDVASERGGYQFGWLREMPVSQLSDVGTLCR